MPETVGVMKACWPHFSLIVTILHFSSALLTHECWQNLSKFTNQRVHCIPYLGIPGKPVAFSRYASPLCFVRLFLPVPQLTECLKEATTPPPKKKKNPPLTTYLMAMAIFTSSQLLLETLFTIAVLYTPGSWRGLLGEWGVLPKNTKQWPWTTLENGSLDPTGNSITIWQLHLQQIFKAITL